MAAWAEAAVQVRFLQQIMARLGDPAEGAPLAQDDESHYGEYLSEAVRANLTASLENLHLWANTVSPLVFIDGYVVENPPRPYFTLARAGLESAAQAAWVLSPETSDARIERHLRLAVDNLDEMRKAVRESDKELAASTQARIDAIKEAYPGDIKSAPSYVAMVREAAPQVGITADEGEQLWRTASAAAHGKRWFTSATHLSVVGEEFAPGRRRAQYVPESRHITESVTFAMKVVQSAVSRYGKLLGAPLAQVTGQALGAVEQNMPRRVKVVGLDRA